MSCTYLSLDLAVSDGKLHESIHGLKIAKPLSIQNSNYMYMYIFARVLVPKMYL